MPSIEEEYSIMSFVRTPRPVPLIQDDHTFSRKKKSLLKDNQFTPRSPIKSAPPVSRIFRNRQSSTPGAHAVSFRQSHTGGEISIKSPLYKTFNKLFFDQCFTKLSKVGTGSFGEVWKVQSKEDGRLYAIKRSRDRFRGDYDRKQKLEEVNKSEHIPGHPNCIHFYKAWEEADHLYIQSELCEMSLKDYSESVNAIEEKEIWNMVVDLCHGLKNIHDAGFVHMDIKPANLFLGRDGQYKIGDFGLVVELTRDLADAMDGDSKYLAPEIMEGCFSKAADIFSLGITILELACSLELPNSGVLWQDLRNKQLPFEFTEGLSDDLILLITSMMEPDRYKRPTVDEILNMSSVKRAESERRQFGVYQKMKMWFAFVYLCLISSFVYFCGFFNFKSKPLPPKRPLSPPPISESMITQDNEPGVDIGHESLINSSFQNDFVTNHSPHVSPLLLKKSPLFLPVSEKKGTGLWRASSPENNSRSPLNFESPACSPQSAILSEKIKRSRLFTCSSDDEEVFEQQEVPKNLMNSFDDTIS